MKKLPTEASRVLLLLQLDAQRLFERIKYREVEYMRIFSYRRTREHFKEIFKSRWDETSIEYLAFCSEDVINSLDQFYTKVEELRWYLMNTEDMPATVSDNVNHYVYEIGERFDLLQLYINAELGVVKEQKQVETKTSVNEEPPPQDDFLWSTSDDGEFKLTDEKTTDDSEAS